MSQKRMIQTVGDLKKVLEDAKDDDLILAQLVSVDGNAWNLGCDAAKVGTKAFCIQLSHPRIETLPPNFFHFQ